MRPVARALFRRLPTDLWSCVGLALAAWFIGYAASRMHAVAWTCAAVVGAACTARAVAARLAGPPPDASDPGRIAELERELGITPETTAAPDVERDTA